MYNLAYKCYLLYYWGLYVNKRRVHTKRCKWNFRRRKADIKNFLQGAVYCWCKNDKDEWFSLRDLMGGANFHWQGTPLIKLYEKHRYKKDSVKSAGIDAGWLLKAVINDDERVFETRKRELIRQYRWVDSNEKNE